jgi:hypothetical protein
MVNEADRFVLNKIYVGRATLFGLVYGLIIGLIVGIIMAILGLVGVGVTGVDGYGLIGGNSTFMMFVTPILAYTVGGVIGGLVSALLYNLVSLVGVKVHVNLGKHMIAPKTVKVAAKPASKSAAAAPNVQIK